MATHTRDEREVQLEFIHEPIDARSRFEAQHLGNFWFLGTALHGVGEEDVI
jgi:hypothetical protein